jgi:hypothetical protein
MKAVCIERMLRDAQSSIRGPGSKGTVDHLETRCAVLIRSGYQAEAAVLPEAETILLTEEFDLVIVLRARDHDGKPLLVLNR